MFSLIFNIFFIANRPHFVIIDYISILMTNRWSLIIYEGYGPEQDQVFGSFSLDWMHFYRSKWIKTQ